LVPAASFDFYTNLQEYNSFFAHLCDITVAPYDNPAASTPKTSSVLEHKPDKMAEGPQQQEEVEKPQQLPVEQENQGQHEQQMMMPPAQRKAKLEFMDLVVEVQTVIVNFV
jgi:hypothetical protein